MTALYVTRNGDMVDYVAWKHYGSRTGAVEAVLDANPGLADAGVVLPAGRTVTLPDLPAGTTQRVVRIWG